MQLHSSDPSTLIEATFRRIEHERMAGLPMLNSALQVAAVGFKRQQTPHAEWLGVLLTPWSLGLLLLPASADWPPVTSHARVFRAYPAGNFAFLGNHEDGLGDYLVCPLVHEMSQFADQETAVLTARASLIALEMAPPQTEADPVAPASAGRRKFINIASRG
jgi:[NiFe] hydrogenase assembly HybE family chaperone